MSETAETANLTEHEEQILREIDEQLPPSPWGAWIGAAYEGLRALGFVEGGITTRAHITPAGRKWLDDHPLRPEASDGQIYSQASFQGAGETKKQFLAGIRTEFGIDDHPLSPKADPAANPDASVTEASGDGAGAVAFQERVAPWMQACFGPIISADREERNHRFLEEALELVQSLGCTASEAHQLVDYVYGREVGDPKQEVGGVMVTLAALCLANGLDMHDAAEAELARIWTKVDKIRAKQAAKPKHSPLPEHAATPPSSSPAEPAPPVTSDPVAAVDVIAERRRQLEVEGWTPEHDDAHADGSLAMAASSYALSSIIARADDRAAMVANGPNGATGFLWRNWPASWARAWFKPGTRRTDLVKAGALILAEIERLDRAALRSSSKGGA